jgi:hypothetical protein
MAAPQSKNRATVVKVTPQRVDVSLDTAELPGDAQSVYDKIALCFQQIAQLALDIESRDELALFNSKVEMARLQLMSMKEKYGQ